MHAGTKAARGRHAKFRASGAPRQSQCTKSHHRRTVHDLHAALTMHRCLGAMTALAGTSQEPTPEPATDTCGTMDHVSTATQHDLTLPLSRTSCGPVPCQQWRPATSRAAHARCGCWVWLVSGALGEARRPRVCRSERMRCSSVLTNSPSTSSGSRYLSTLRHVWAGLLALLAPWPTCVAWSTFVPRCAVLFAAQRSNTVCLHEPARRSILGPARP